MRVIEDVFSVDQRPLESVRGAKPEAEERPTQHVMTLSGAALSGGTDKEVKGFLPVQLVTSMTTYEAAEIVGAQCGRCAHFDNDGWRAKYAEMVKSASNVDFCNRLRLIFLTSEDPEVRRRHGLTSGEIDAEAGIASMGICQHFAIYPCDPRATCPTHIARRQADGSVQHEPVQVGWEGRTRKIQQETISKRDQLLKSASIASKK